MTEDGKAHLPHDRLVKWVLTRPEAAAVELRQVLPAAIAEKLDWPTLRVRSGSFIDPKLTTRHSDILYEVRLRGTKRSVLVYVLLEHQSTPDRLMAWRLLQYIVRIWEQTIREHSGPLRHLPLIVPVVLYQGSKGWAQPRRLSELIDLPDDLRDAIEIPIELTFEVDELGDSVLADQHTRDGILALVEATRVLLRLAHRPEEITRERVAPLAPLFEQIMTMLGIDDVQALWTYVISAFEPDSPLRDILVRAASPELRTMYATIYDEAVAKGKLEGLAEGKREGLAEGKREGIAEGKTQMLLRLLDKRGFVLIETQRQRIATCTDESQLQRWFDRALAAAMVDEVFESSEE